MSAPVPQVGEVWTRKKGGRRRVAALVDGLVVYWENPSRSQPGDPGACRVYDFWAECDPPAITCPMCGVPADTDSDPCPTCWTKADTGKCL